MGAGLGGETAEGDPIELFLEALDVVGMAMAEQPLAWSTTIWE
jgi:hypothetical protein